LHLEEPGVHPDESPETSRAGDLDRSHKPWLRQSGRMFSNVQGSTGRNRGKRSRRFITSMSLRCQYGKTTHLMLYLFGDCGIKSDRLATFQLGCQPILKVTLTCFRADLPAGGSRSFSRSPMKLSVGVSKLIRYRKKAQMARSFTFSNMASIMAPALSWMIASAMASISVGV
jgi:hypothetical protein